MSCYRNRRYRIVHVMQSLAIVCRIGVALLLLASSAHTLHLRDATESQRLPVWVWWNFPDGVPTAFRLNVRTWLQHMPADKFELHLVNESNIREYFPNLPEEFNRLYGAAKTDFVRGSMLALHGGVYMDGDMILNQDLGVVFKDVWNGKVDVMPYLFDKAKCPFAVTTNFMAGVKGNALNTRWLDTMLERLKSRCDASVSRTLNGNGNPKGRTVCCYHPDGTPRDECFINFGALGDQVFNKAMRESANGTHPLSVRVNCTSADQGMAVPRSGTNGELLWKRLVAGPPSGFVPSKMQFPYTKWGDIPKYDRRMETCWRVNSTGLECSATGALPGFFDRNGLHQFNVLNGGVLQSFRTEEELLASETVAAEFYKHALRGEEKEKAQPDPRYVQLRLAHMRNILALPDELSWGDILPDTKVLKMPWLAPRQTQVLARTSWRSKARTLFARK